MATAFDRVTNSLGNLNADAISLTVEELGEIINGLISDVGQLHYVSPGDLNVFGVADGTSPQTIEDAMRYGTKLFDAIYYFAIEVANRPSAKAGADLGHELPAIIVKTKKRLLWTAIFLMLRGSYPSSASSQSGKDVPAFLLNIAGMDESPHDVARGLASFDLKNIPTGWVRHIQWNTMAPEIRQRLALGLAGYRLLGPFKIYSVKPDASPEVRAAAEWVRHVAVAPADYSILSATRSAALISRLGSWNKALGNLILLAFTEAQIAEMVSNKIIFAKPTRDPRSDTWRSWAPEGDLQLTDPINL